MNLISIEQILEEQPPEDGWRRYKPTGEYIITLDLGGKKVSFRARKMDDTPDKPPLGLKPKYIHDEQRAAEIKAAIKRYLDNGKKIPVEWINELNELMGGSHEGT